MKSTNVWGSVFSTVSDRIILGDSLRMRMIDLTHICFGMAFTRHPHIVSLMRTKNQIDAQSRGVYYQMYGCLVAKYGESQRHSG